VTDLIFHALAWPTLAAAVLVFGLGPGVVLRMIVLFYPRSNPRRQELLGELYHVPRIERPFWVAEQLEVALFEGLPARFKSRKVVRDRAARLRAGIVAALFAGAVSLGLTVAALMVTVLMRPYSTAWWIIGAVTGVTGILCFVCAVFLHSLRLYNQKRHSLPPGGANG
jgi:hypothetical protein